MAGVVLSPRQRWVLRQAADGGLKHRTTGIEAWWTLGPRGYVNRANATAESLMRAGLIERGTEPLGNPDWPYFAATLTAAGRALLAVRAGVS